MSEFSNRRQALEDKIDEMEKALAALKAQLKVEEEREQHEAIDRLEDFLGEVDNKHASLQEFWAVLREEIRELFSGSAKKTGTER